MMSSALLSHWPLHADARDVAGGLHGVAKDVRFGAVQDGRSAACFNGQSSAILVGDTESVRLASRDFTYALWIRAENPMRGVYGDILSKFDQQRRCGVNLRMAASSTAYSSIGDSRHLSFAID